jgi:hypothetical protein
VVVVALVAMVRPSEATVLDKAAALAAGATVVQLATAGQEAYPQTRSLSLELVFMDSVEEVTAAMAATASLL